VCDPRHSKFRFPDGEISDKDRKRREGNIHRVSEFSATRVQDSLLREVRFPDTIREIIEGHSVGVRTSDKGVEEKI
jgi:hypothetical protein